jgi:hypothetical protein
VEQEVQGYSYVLSDRPVEIPDDTSEGVKTTQAYQNLGDGIHYFHIKAIRAGSWGGVTHFAVKIDGSPPARFQIEVSPSQSTVVRKPVLSFTTTDALSGVDHYDVKIVPLTPQPEEGEPPSQTSEYFFTEQRSPYVPELKVGDYDVLIRAYDRAGNYTEETTRISVLPSVLWALHARGLQIGTMLIPWIVLWSVFGLLAAVALFFAWHFWRWHTALSLRHRKAELPPAVKAKIDELKALREKYKGVALLLVALFTGVSLLGAPLLQGHAAQEASQGVRELSPPVVTEVSRNISNQELFYIGGKTVVLQGEVKIFLQNLENGETTSYTVTSDTKGDWFYSHPTFLTSGDYLIWTQMTHEGVTSPPSAQVPLRVSKTALQFGASRISYETLYLTVAVGLLLVVIVMAIVALYHRYHGGKKHAALLEEVRKAEAMLHRGFAVLRRDIEAELALIEKARASGTFSPREQAQEEKILADLKRIEEYIGRELWEVEREV